MLFKTLRKPWSKRSALSIVKSHNSEKYFIIFFIQILHSTPEDQKNLRQSCVLEILPVKCNHFSKMIAVWIIFAFYFGFSNRTLASYCDWLFRLTPPMYQIAQNLPVSLLLLQRPIWSAYTLPHALQSVWLTVSGSPFDIDICQLDSFTSFLWWESTFAKDNIWT